MMLVYFSLDDEFLEKRLKKKTQTNRERHVHVHVHECLKSKLLFSASFFKKKKKKASPSSLKRPISHPRIFILKILFSLYINWKKPTEIWSFKKKTWYTFKKLINGHRQTSVLQGMWFLKLEGLRYYITEIQGLNYYIFTCLWTRKELSQVKQSTHHKD